MLKAGTAHNKLRKSPTTLPPRTILLYLAVRPKYETLFDSIIVVCNGQPHQPIILTHYRAHAMCSDRAERVDRLRPTRADNCSNIHMRDRCVNSQDVSPTDGSATPGPWIHHPPCAKQQHAAAHPAARLTTLNCFPEYGHPWCPKPMREHNLPMVETCSQKQHCRWTQPNTKQILNTSLYSFKFCRHCIPSRCFHEM